MATPAPTHPGGGGGRALASGPAAPAVVASLPAFRVVYTLVPLAVAAVAFAVREATRASAPSTTTTTRRSRAEIG